MLIPHPHPYSLFFFSDHFRHANHATSVQARKKESRGSSFLTGGPSCVILALVLPGLSGWRLKHGMCFFPTDLDTDITLILNDNPFQCDARMCWLGDEQTGIHFSYYYGPPQCDNYPGLSWDDVLIKLPAGTTRNSNMCMILQIL